MSELAAWSGRHAAAVGVPARNTPDPEPAAVTRRMFVGTELEESAGATTDADNGVILALGTAGDDALARLRAGEATSQLVLTATSLGLASCIVTEPLEVKQTRDKLREDVFGGSQFPQMLLHVGWAPVNADPLPATPRRALREVVSGLDGTPVGT